VVVHASAGHDRSGPGDALGIASKPARAGTCNTYIPMVAQHAGVAVGSGGCTSATASLVVIRGTPIPNVCVLGTLYMIDTVLERRQDLHVQETPMTDQNGGRTVQLLWGLRKSPSRGPRPTLNVRQIAQTAVAIADMDGLGAVSMQRVAGELDFTKMSLYRYVAGKAELIAVMIEEAVGDPPDLGAIAGDWREKLTTWAHLLWETWDRHQWLPAATEGARPMGPNEAGWVETALGPLHRTGLTEAEQLAVIRLISGHIRNTHSARRSGTGLDPAQYGSGFSSVLADHSDEYPALLAASMSPTTLDTRTFGLARIINGVSQLIEERTRAST
jgi:AcrR family transcriptional regulator